MEDQTDDILDRRKGRIVVAEKREEAIHAVRGEQHPGGERSEPVAVDSNGSQSRRLGNEEFDEASRQRVVVARSRVPRRGGCVAGLYAGGSTTSRSSSTSSDAPRVTHVRVGTGLHTLV